MHTPPMPTRTDSDEALELRRLRAELMQSQRELAACQAREAQALVAAQLDPLTGLPNRRVFDARMGQQLKSHASRRALLAVLFVDLDDFKAVNDVHGHSVGDGLLQMVGLRLRHAMRQQDLACRLGGDEFVCVLLNLRSEQELQIIQHKLHLAVSRPCHLGGLALSVNPSIGAALFPRDGGDAAALLSHADRSMYRSKRRQLALVPPSMPTRAAAQPCST